MNQSAMEKLLEFIENLNKEDTANSTEQLNDYMDVVYGFLARANWILFNKLKEQGFSEEQSFQIVLNMVDS